MDFFQHMPEYRAGKHLQYHPGKPFAQGWKWTITAPGCYGPGPSDQPLAIPASH